jgi:small subunit ribosomal protein S9
MEETKIVLEEEADKNADSKKKSEYLYAVGRRKTAVAKVKIMKKGNGEISVNGKEYKTYFPQTDLQRKVYSAIKTVGQTEKLDIIATVLGGGVSSQAEAIRHGISRALIQLNPNFKKPLKKAGFLTRDSRRKERKKPGLKRARKAPQWQKR